MTDHFGLAIFLFIVLPVLAVGIALGFLVKWLLS